MPSLYARLLYVVVFITFGSGVNAAETDADGRLYVASDDPVADVQQALSRAAENDRRVLVVSGANWCHDSRALASRLYQAPLSEVIEQQYELVFVDVGFYELDRSVMQQLGVAHYYATPTVLVIEPSSGQPINGNDRHIWGNAYNIDMPTSVQYFEKWSEYKPAMESAEDSDQLLQLYAEIDQFEQDLAERLVGGYASVGPMLKATVDGVRPEEFDGGWDELRDFRMAIPGAMRELRGEAQRRVSEGEADIQLEFPEYALLSWEVE